MRNLIALLLFLTYPLLLLGEPPTPPRWGEPFEAISPSTADSQLVLLVITNDDPFEFEKQIRRLADEGTEDGEQDESLVTPPVWCGPVLLKALRKALTTRPDLEERLRLQVQAAGIPAELTGGKPRNIPSRAMVMLCDGQYRLLAVSVGAPDANQLLDLIEDAEDVKRSLSLQADLKQRELIGALADRNRPRLSRMWRNVLDDVLQSFDGVVKQVPRADKADTASGRIQSLAEALQPAYEVDVRLRFGLTDQTDRQRLAILEQHPETRGSWCNVMTPFVAGADVIAHWRELTETVWGYPPITTDDGEDAEEIDRWITEQLPSNSVVLIVQPPNRVAALPWPPSTSSKRGKAWLEVHNEALEHPSRIVHPQQLATLIRDRGMRSIDAYQPSLMRYLVLQQGDSTPMVIRESDSPGRFAAILQRSQSQNAQP